MKYYCQKGYTLIEVIIAFFIIIMLSSIVITSFTSVSRRQLNRAALELQADLRYAQNMALQEGTAYSIMFFVQNNSYIIRRMENGRYVTIKEVNLQNVEILNTTATNNTVIFSSKGTTANPCTVNLHNDNYRVSLTISLGAGRVLIQDMIPM